MGTGVEHGIVCIDCFCVLICSMGDVLCLYVLVCVNFGDKILLRGEECKIRGKNSIFLKKSKTVISVENKKFSRSRMTKRTSSLNSSHEI